MSIQDAMNLSEIEANCNNLLKDPSYGKEKARDLTRVLLRYDLHLVKVVHHLRSIDPQVKATMKDGWLLWEGDLTAKRMFEAVITHYPRPTFDV